MALKRGPLPGPPAADPAGRDVSDDRLRVSGTFGAAGGLPKMALARLFSMLQSGCGIDFTHYKASTVERRIRRRMKLQNIDSLDRYLTLVGENRGELAALCNDILIRVTGFFRDPEVFAVLERVVIPHLTAGRGSDDPVRVWVPGCATGEEVYSLAIVLLEAARMKSPIQIFGTDVSEAAIEHARAAVYSDKITADVSSERLGLFFTRMDGSYRVNETVRDCCVFARQDLTSDRPFSDVDLISCRNVMIYLGAILQRKVMPIFHSALRKNGYLLLGRSESVGDFSHLFGVVDRRHKIYRKRAALHRTTTAFPPDRPAAHPQTVQAEEEMSGTAAHCGEGAHSANEEIQSSHQELQSANEELEPANEERQSRNEEIPTDLANLLASADIPVVLLDPRLRLRRFSPAAQRVLSLISSDVGRSLDDLRTTLQVEDVGKIVAEAMDQGELREIEVPDRSGRRYWMRIRPCKSAENKGDGAVLVLLDIGK